MEIVQNGKIALKDRKFKVDSEIKEEFLSTLTASTAKTVKGVLLKVDEYEDNIGKEVYNLNFTEIDDLIESSFSNKSIASVRSTISYIRKYINYCIDKNLVLHMENRFMAISNPNKYVDKNAMNNKYITIEQLYDIESKLVNACDKCILDLLFIGVKPEEIRNLENDKINFKDKTITLENDNGDFRTLINVNDHTLNLLESTIRQMKYLINNGSNKSRYRQDVEVGRGLGTREFSFAESCYVFKTSSKFSPDTKIRKNLVQERVRVIRGWAGVNYLTTTSINTSGIINAAWEMMKAKNSKLDKFDYEILCETFQYAKPKVDLDGVVSYGSEVWRLKEIVEKGLEALKLYLK